MSAPKAKVYRINIAGVVYLVYALTQAGALRNLFKHLADDDRLDCRLATGEELFAAGKAGTELIAEGDYKRVDDPNQSNLPIDETDTAGA
jgi:hypothetical protein